MKFTVYIPCVNQNKPNFLSPNQLISHIPYICIYIYLSLGHDLTL